MLSEAIRFLIQIVALQTHCMDGRKFRRRQEARTGATGDLTSVSTHRPLPDSDAGVRGLELRCGERKFTSRGLSHTWIYSERSPCRRYIKSKFFPLHIAVRVLSPSVRVGSSRSVETLVKSPVANIKGVAGHNQQK